MLIHTTTGEQCEGTKTATEQANGSERMICLAHGRIVTEVAE